MTNDPQHHCVICYAPVDYKTQLAAANETRVRLNETEGELEALRGKLRQAVEALRVIANHNTNPRSAMDIARQALREMEGSAEG